MTTAQYRFVFIDHGDTDDEAVAVGPFDTEDAATVAAQGRTVMALWSLDTFRDSPQAAESGYDHA